MRFQSLLVAGSATNGLARNGSAWVSQYEADLRRLMEREGERERDEKAREKRAARTVDALAASLRRRSARGTEPAEETPGQARARQRRAGV